MMQMDKQLLSRTLLRAVTGTISLRVRKRLAHGEALNIMGGDEPLVISVENNKAILKRNGRPLLEMPFTPWTKIDEDYEFMIESMSDEGRFEVDYFERTSNVYHSRFDKAADSIAFIEAGPAEDVKDIH